MKLYAQADPINIIDTDKKWVKNKIGQQRQLMFLVVIQH